MTRIDFHSNVPDKLAYACRLVRRARAANCKVVVLVRDQAQCAALDEALWTFSELDFLPHVMLDNPLAARTPVLLTADPELESPHHQVLVNLSDAAPVNFARYERMFEVISAADADKAAGRERYRFYQQRGYPLTHFVAENT